MAKKLRGGFVQADEPKTKTPENPDKETSQSITPENPDNEKPQSITPETHKKIGDLLKNT